MNEDVMWERLKDRQQEAESRRLGRSSLVPAGLRSARRLFVALASRPAPRRRPVSGA